MNSNQLKEDLLSKVEAELIKFDFKLKKSLCEFTEITSDGWNKYQLIFLIREDGWEINLGMLIRKNIVEDIYHRASYFDPKYHKTTPTIGITIEDYIRDGNQYRFDLRNVEDLNVCCSGIAKLFKEIALPFYDKYSSLDRIEKDINVKEGKSIFSGIKYEGNIGIILAKLTHNPEYELLKEKYLKYYSEKYDGFYLNEYIGIIKVLEEIV